MSFTPVHIIIVTHNSMLEIPLCLNAIAKQTLQPASVVLVDSGSDQTDYIDQQRPLCSKIIKCKNIGFSRANNIGLKQVRLGADDIVIFLNPDAFMEKDVLFQVVGHFSRNPGTGCLTGKLLGYDLDTDQPTGYIDSTGIFRKFYGRWFDRGQGEEDRGQYQAEQHVPAVCGAFMCCRAAALQSLGAPVFDEAFFLYKEDIELSLRIYQKQWNIVYLPSIVVYHCRGWAAQRREMSYSSRLLSAQNEVLLYKRHRSPYILWAVGKYLAVRYFKI